jgi:hypothetical protein
VGPAEAEADGGTGDEADATAPPVESEAALGATGDEPTDPEAAPLPADGMALYAREFHPLALEERILRAREATPAELSALCFDPSPRVIAAVLASPRTGLAQARLIARHHRDASGLERLVATPAFAADAAVRLELLKNPQLQAPVLRRLWGQRRALELWKSSTSREATEQARHTLKELFRARFQAGEAEERVEVIVKSDGRCLPSLPTSPLDGRTVALLCTRSYTSTLLVQHLARWGATPPALLAHLLRQALVRQNRALRLLVLQHPNAPAPEG